MRLDCRGKLIDLNTPKILGILNLTPDSFYDGGKFNVKDKSLKQCEKMLNEGATFIDVGAISSKPGASDLNLDIEKKRLYPILEALIINFPDSLFSIDTFRYEIAEESLKMGAVMINDISGGKFNSKMYDIISKYDCPYIMMHRKGKSFNMQKNPNYHDVVNEVKDFFTKQIKIANERGVKKIIIDLGFGFGKTIEQNFKLLKEMKKFRSFKYPILSGISRKSMIWKKLNISPKNSLNGTTFLHAFALKSGSKLLRVHDVKKAKECIDLFEALN